MANHLAIAAVAKTILKMVEDHCPRDEFASTPTFTLYAGHDFAAQPVTEGFSLLVWRLSVNTAVRSFSARREPDGRKRRPPLPVDVSMLLTAWSSEPERQLRLTGWALRFLEDNAIVPAALLNQSLSRRTVPAFRPDEAIELMLEAPSLPDYLGLWDKFRNRWQTSLTYVARPVLLESDIVIDEGALVETRDFRHGQIDTRTPGGQA
jgi:Pvc16 N-terminal domain